MKLLKQDRPNIRYVQFDWSLRALGPIYAKQIRKWGGMGWRTVSWIHTGAIFDKGVDLLFSTWIGTMKKNKTKE